MRLVWNLVIIGAQELDEDWTKILETDQPMQSGYQPQQQGYVSKLYSLPAIRQSPGSHEKMRRYSKQMLCTYCRYKRSALQKVHKSRKARLGSQICGSEYPFRNDCFDVWHSDWFISNTPIHRTKHICLVIEFDYQLLQRSSHLFKLWSLFLQVHIPRETGPMYCTGRWLGLGWYRWLRGLSLSWWW